MTDFKQGETYSGFTLEKKETVQEINSTVFLFRHKLLGTPVFAIKNSDENKTFSVAFQTVPEDSTGVAHILEHCVLMGSKKYPVRDVFGEINKGGLMTFLNAMTGSDVTWYPFATRNMKEYFNILDVYCDVTLNPLILRDTFEQEGWHYHKEEKDQPTQFQGVVFNEMKGAFSDPFRSIFHHVFKELMPDSTYVHESGGDPKNIPELSYEKFVEFHHKHYHPSNATIFFYGNAPLSEELAFLQERFLASYKNGGEKIPLKQGSEVNEHLYIDDTYGVQPGSDLDGKTFHVVCSTIGTVLEVKRNTAYKIISNILYNSDASPLKKKIMESGYCKDFGGLFLPNSCFKTFMMTYMVGSEPHFRDNFQKLFEQTLQEIVEQTLDRDLVLSELNKFEFSAREEMIKAQRGLDLIGKAMPLLKHGGDPFGSLCVDELFAQIRKEALEDNYFERLIQDFLLNNPSAVTVTLRPDPNKIIETLQAEQKQLADYENSLDDTAIETLITHTNDLLELQQKPNSDEELKQLPHLTIADLTRPLNFHAVEARELGGRPFLVNNLPTNSISYMDFGFNCSGLSAEQLSYLDLFASIVTEIGTKDKDFMAFAKALNICTGGFSHSFNTHLHVSDPKNPRPLLWFHLKSLSGYLDSAMELAAEIFSSVSFSDRQHIREIVQREYAWAEHSVQSEGYGLASSRVFANLGLAGMYNEYVSGVTSYQVLKNLAQQYDSLEERFLQICEEIKRSVFHRNGLTISITSTEKDIARFENKSGLIIDSLEGTELSHGPPQFETFVRNQAFTSSAEVVYNVQGCNLMDHDSYNGHFDVLKTWLSRDFLWNTVRQIGGAYGCFIQFNNISGNFALVSYRDPQIRKTYETFNSIAQSISELTLSDQALQQLIIGAYGKFDPHHGPAAKGATARNEYLSGITPEYKQRCVDAIKSTCLADLKKFAPAFQNLIDNSYLATIGNTEKINTEMELFDEIVDI